MDADSGNRRARPAHCTGAAIQLVVIAIFYAVILTVGLYASRRESRGEGTTGLILASRNIPLTIGLFTMTATWVGGGYINGTAEAVYDKARGMLWAQAPWGYAVSLVIGGVFFARVMRRHQFTTMLDPFDQRYGARVASILFIPALIGEIFWSAAILTALGTTFGTILDFDFTTAILISAAIAVGYTMVGGLLSVAYTDVIQLIFILVGLGLALPYALEHGGGLGAVFAQYAADFGANASLLPQSDMDGWVWVWGDFALLLVFGGIPWQVYFQRVLACRTEQTAMGMSIAAAVGCLVMAIPAVIIGQIGAVADWSAVGVEAPTNAALVLPYVLQHLTPPLIATIGLGAVAAAVMSSVDSSILSSSSMFVWNVYRRIIRPAATERETRIMLRVAILCVGAVATILALKVKSVYVLWYLCADLVYVVLFPQLTMALWSKSANAIGAVAAVAVGLLLRLGGGEPVLGLPGFIPYPMTAADGSVLFPFRTFAMVMSFITIFVVSRATQRLQAPRPLSSD